MKKYTIEEATAHLHNGGAIENDNENTVFLNNILREATNSQMSYAPEGIDTYYFLCSNDWDSSNSVDGFENKIIKLSQISYTPTEPEKVEFVSELIIDSKDSPFHSQEPQTAQFTFDPVVEGKVLTPAEFCKNYNSEAKHHIQGVDDFLLHQMFEQYAQLREKAIVSEAVELLQESLTTIKWMRENCVPDHNNLYEDFFNIPANCEGRLSDFLSNHAKK